MGCPWARLARAASGARDRFLAACAARGVECTRTPGRRILAPGPESRAVKCLHPQRILHSTL
eukprot:6888475-Pyramimonas_sp.AAC.1